jgi:glycosyltransferase involved in cell wall biosynthesis
MKCDLQMAGRLPSICFVAPNAYPLLAGDQSTEFAGGAELQQVTIAKGLAERGYSVSMICLDFGQTDQLQIDGVRVLRAFSRAAGVPVLRFIHPRLTSLWRCLQRADADIYYQRTAGMLTGVVAAFCKWHGKKSVFAAAGNPDLERNTRRIRFARDRWIYEYGLRNDDRILVQNEEQARLCWQNFGRSAALVPSFYTGRPQPVTDGHYVLWVSTIRGLKRPELLLDLAEALPQYRFRMIGGPDRSEPRLFETVKARARTIPNVEFLGFVPHAQVESHFDDALLLVNTSESEGFPNAFLQAWARGIPTVSFVDSGARFDNQPLGVIVDSMPTLLAAVATLVADESARRIHTSRCLDYVAMTHAAPRVLDLYDQVFRELTSSPNNLSASPGIVSRRSPPPL